MAEAQRQCGIEEDSFVLYDECEAMKSEEEEDDWCLIVPTTPNDLIQSSPCQSLSSTPSLLSDSPLPEASSDNNIHSDEDLVFCDGHYDECDASAQSHHQTQAAENAVNRERDDAFASAEGSPLLEMDQLSHLEDEELPIDYSEIELYENSLSAEDDLMFDMCYPFDTPVGGQHSKQKKIDLMGNRERKKGSKNTFTQWRFHKTKHKYIALSHFHWKRIKHRQKEKMGIFNSPFYWGFYRNKYFY